MNIEENNLVPCHAINPFTRERTPIYLRNESEFGTLNSQGVPYADAKLGIPSLDQYEKDFAIKNGLKITEILQDDTLINSDKVEKKNIKKLKKIKF